MKDTNLEQLADGLIINGITSLKEHPKLDLKKNLLRNALVEKLISKKWFSSNRQNIELLKEDLELTKEVKSLDKYSKAYLISIIHEKTVNSIEKGEISKDLKSTERKVKGSFFTPKEVAKYIVSNSIDNQKLDKAPTFLDPACGGGVFLVAYIQYLDNLDQNFSLRTISENIYGVDLDERAVETSMIVLSFLTGSNKKEVENQIKEGNSLISKYEFSQESLSSHLEQGIDLNSFFDNVDEKKPFDWQDEFPEIFDDTQGFDIICMNPPYKRLKANKSEFNSSKRYEKRKKEVREEKEYFKNISDYKNSTGRSMNYYSLMIERSIDLANENASLGVICPLTITLDKSTSDLRSKLLNEGVFSCINYSERANLFGPSVSQSVSILHIDRASNRDLKISPVYDEWKPNPSVAMVKKSLLSEISKYSYLPPIDEEEWSIIQKIHREERIRDISSIKQYRGELDISIHSEFIEADGVHRLVRGDQISYYELDRSTSKDSYAKKKEFIQENSNSTKIQYIDQERLVCQQVSNLSNNKRLKFCKTEAGDIVANSCNFIVSLGSYESEYLQGILNSLLMEWRFRVTSSNNHINNYEIADFPIKSPDGKLEDKICKLVSEQNDSFSQENQNKIDSLVFHLYELNENEISIIMSKLDLSEERRKDLKKFYDKVRL